MLILLSSRHGEGKRVSSRDYDRSELRGNAHSTEDTIFIWTKCRHLLFLKIRLFKQKNSALFLLESTMKNGELKRLVC